MFEEFSSASSTIISCGSETFNGAGGLVSINLGVLAVWTPAALIGERDPVRVEVAAPRNTRDGEAVGDAVILPVPCLGGEPCDCEAAADFLSIVGLLDGFAGIFRNCSVAVGGRLWNSARFSKISHLVSKI
jgi:hypothetical protein